MAERLLRLERAKEYIFSTGVGDVTSVLAEKNMAYGLAKMHYVQEIYGLKPDATYITAPDQSITRNSGRWLRNISYGGKISWGSGKDKLVMLDVKPNACGVTMAGLEELPTIKEIIERVHQLEVGKHVIMGVPVKWDMFKSNHFINIYKTTAKGLPAYILILHAGAAELKGKNPKGPGLYHDGDGTLSQIMTTHETPFGPCSVLYGKNVKKYMKFHSFALKFSARRRELAIKSIFPDARIIASKHHQHLVNQNEVHLGVYHTQKGKIYPITLREDLPAFLVKASQNFTLQQLRELGWKERAQRLGVLQRLLNANILPHGAGYAFPNVQGIKSIVEINKTVHFVLSLKHSSNTYVAKDCHDLPYGYRGIEIYKHTLALGMCMPYAELQPVHVLKI